jgi:hypothetical protein
MLNLTSSTPFPFPEQVTVYKYYCNCRLSTTGRVRVLHFCFGFYECQCVIFKRKEWDVV